MIKASKKIKERNLIKQENILIPSNLIGNFIKIPEPIIKYLFNLPQKKKKYIISVYLYVKIRLNESYSNQAKITLRELANAFNTNVRNIHDAISHLKKLDIDIKIKSSNNHTTISKVDCELSESGFIPFEKTTLKSIFDTGVNATAIYSLLYTNIHQVISFSRGNYNGMMITSRSISDCLKISKNIIPKELDKLKDRYFINKETKRHLGSLITLTDIYIKSDYIDKEKLIIPYSKHLDFNNPIYETLAISIIPYSKHMPPEISFLKVETEENKEPSYKELYIKEPKEEKVFSNKFGGDDLPDEQKIEKLSNQIDFLEEKQIKLISKINNKNSLDGFNVIKSSYYDGKSNIYNLYHKGNKIYIEFGSRLLDIDQYIQDTNSVYQKVSEDYIKFPDAWKKSLIRNFDKREDPNKLNPYEFRIKSYIERIVTEVEEEINLEIKSIREKISKLIPMNNIVNDNKDPNMVNLEKIKEFNNEHPDVFQNIKEELNNSIQQYKLNVSPDYLMNMLINRINAYKNGNPYIYKYI